MYTDINVETTDRRTLSDYQEIAGEQTFNSPPFSYTSTDVREADRGVPQEYLQPPPFALGY